MATTPPKELNLDEIATAIQAINDRMAERENQVKALKDLIEKDKEEIKKLTGEKEKLENKQKADITKAENIKRLLQQTEQKLINLDTAIADTKALFEIPPK